MTRANAPLCSLAMAWVLAPIELLFLLEREDMRWASYTPSMR